MAIWTDPTDYAANAIPTSTGSETTNINLKYTAKIKQLFDYFHGDDNLDFTFFASANTNIVFKLGDSAGTTFFQLLTQAGGTAAMWDSKGQVRAGPLDAVVIAGHFPGDIAVGTKINNLRILAPYTFTATELAMVCDDTQGVGTGGSLRLRVVNSSAGTIGTVTIVPGASVGSANIAATSIGKNTVFSFDAIAIGGGAQPGRDVDLQVRGYRTGTIILGV